MKEMKDKYKEETDGKDKDIARLKDELTDKEKTFENEVAELKDSVSIHL